MSDPVTVFDMSDVPDFGFSLPPTSVGKHSYTISYSGDANFKPSKATFSYRVIPAPIVP